MATFDPKPKLVFFQYKYDDELPAFLLAHKREHVKCLSEFFNVVVVDHDCDYAHICDIHHPDLTLFEGGVPFPSCRRPKVSSAHANAHIPKLGLLNSDAFCCGRAGFLSDMDHLGITTYFAIATAAAENTPAISDSLFIWPNSIDPDLYRDYGVWKSIPVLFAGNNTALYPWRQRMMRLISKNYSSLICNHPGYAPRREQQQIRVGEPYARMLNASVFVPSCGTLAKEVVRKHFEIPACKSCLVTESSPALQAAGFIDMVNCVFADEHDVLDKLSFLFNNQDALEAIVQAGFDLVHRSHTIKQRNQILQWYELNKAAQPHQRILQPGPFEPLRLVDASPTSNVAGIAPGGLHLRLLQQGDQLLAQRNYEGAERLYLKCAQYIPWMPEPKLRLALCDLRKGNASRALSWISEPIQFTLSEYRAADPDPVEWAYFIVATLCSKDIAEAVRCANQFPWLDHEELNRARRAVAILSGRKIVLPAGVGEHREHRRSIHQLPQRNDQAWFTSLCDILTACKRANLAEQIRNYLNRGSAALADLNNRNVAIRQENNDELSNASLTLPPQGKTRYFEWRLRIYKVRAGLKQLVKRGLYGAEARYGYFMPHHLSSSRNDEFYGLIHDLARGEKIGAALVVGADRRWRGTQALIAGLRAQEEISRLVCLKIGGGSGDPFVGAPRPEEDCVKWYGPLDLDPGDMGEQFRNSIRRIKDDNNVTSFDLLLFNGSARVQEDGFYEALYELLRETKYVLLDDVSDVRIHDIYRRLKSEGRHRVTDENPSLRNGYAVLEKRNGNNGRTNASSFDRPVTTLS
ncbi:Glycosyl transferases group 1 [Bradyrhizobium shewense]|uniref:Glycosyl transferases group 1 n=1 Tax=Bradyrhizobium shewense TaxID=1761772 RepID=A0A1C3TZ16_9BRAD|nr:glycosyltransferase [Bradyrhizobium shewense]SCB08477.1 Glycosyl transferases group 1 [Bradyrhizobium shewense]